MFCLCVHIHIVSGSCQAVGTKLFLFFLDNPKILVVFYAFVFSFLVCDEHREFKDLKLFYRFRKDDGTFPLDSEAKVFMRGQRIYEKYVLTRKNTVIPCFFFFIRKLYEGLKEMKRLLIDFVFHLSSVVHLKEESFVAGFHIS